MVYFEFGQYRLAEPHLTAHVRVGLGCDQRCFRPVFYDPDTIFRIFYGTAVAGGGFLALLLGLTFVDFCR